MVAVETISEENINVSEVEPNSSDGARICTWMQRKQQRGLIENAVDHAEEGDADEIKVSFHGSGHLWDRAQQKKSVEQSDAQPEQPDEPEQPDDHRRRLPSASPAR